MTPRIEILPEKKLVGKSIRMSIANDKTFELWRSFMPQRKGIKNIMANELYCLQVYNASLDFNQFTPETEFAKWAAVEVSDFAQIPEGMEPVTLEGGLYAVFLYKGDVASFPPFFKYIFFEWLPASEYELDNSRPHFDLLGEKYKNNDPESEEEIWVPVKKK
ncbi:MAG: GyrI-like domain-containing protein [Bacteroidota bacterium]|nr:GyrI-like domain-containing protein [Bacteroidota bacterium]